MDTSRAIGWGVVAVVAATALLSGPLVPGIDLTTARETPAYGNGSATVDGADLPDAGRLTGGRYGTTEYSLEVPPATLNLTAVRGYPVATYRVRVPALSYTRTTTTFLSPDDAGRTPLTLEPGPVDAAVVGYGPYEAQVTVTLRGDGSERVIADGTVRVEVSE